MAKSAEDRITVQVWLEPDLAAWVKAQAADQQRSTSNWLRFILFRLRAEMAHDPALAATLTGGAPGDTT